MPLFFCKNQIIRFFQRLHAPEPVDWRAVSDDRQEKPNPGRRGISSGLNVTRTLNIFSGALDGGGIKNRGNGGMASPFSAYPVNSGITLRGTSCNVQATPGKTAF